LRIDQDGSESAELAANGSFVVVHVPVVVVGEAPKGGAGLRFRIGSFQGRETKLLIGTGLHAKLTFRIPKELFRPRERLSLEVVARDEADAEQILWAKRYDAGWQGKGPSLEPVADYLAEPPQDEV
jgi:hypothetical protein